MDIITISSSVSVGYHSIAVNQDLRLEKKIPSSASGRSFNQYNRVTILLENHSQLHHMQSECVQQFDIVAVQPTTEKLFQAIEKGIHFEISYSPTIRDSGLRRRVLANAIEIIRVTKGKHYYYYLQQNVIITSGAEKLYVTIFYEYCRIMTKLFHLAAKYQGKVTLNSVRGQLFGLKQGAAKRSICENGRAVLLHGGWSAAFLVGIMILLRSYC
ncbi:uncharacterized protein TRIADDRAFT_58716 [Trichoplax adhaerens]|uniref:Uncharacterized protein n=1 Tax=Trichoplax adhaerens TaxID=10228 RepID=B3S3G8_TRIAD|nr:hypothetical protein TRIADDRAFT_58716 [Trichoplax adhaerens]EDV22967.1 hypothetical protein TRIADDRAFT_58716 [Trichoplax adhaerens]|eukprot:XP_002114833.1 hypothetical protein TRIADDRAFT_58716 [Trichoplax adhaerens]